MPVDWAAAQRNPDADATIRVMVVDDSIVARGLVSRRLDAIDGIEVVAAERDETAAVKGMARSMPDVVVLDIEMPEMDGMAARPELLEIKPDCRVITTSAPTRRNAEISIRALSLGALDYLAIPVGARGISTGEGFHRRPAEKVRALGGSARTGAPVPADAGAGISFRKFSQTPPKVIVIGASTGGPRALMALTRSMTPSVGMLPVLITQHMPPTFTAIVAAQIGAARGWPSKEAEHGEVIQPGRVYLAPGGYHMLIGKSGTGVRTLLDDGPPVNFCRPAADPMFQAAVEQFRGAVLGVILTGMGHDGCNGARAVADASGNIIAHDEATSVVWGMPGTAAAAGVCCDVLPLQQIGPRIARAIKGCV